MSHAHKSELGPYLLRWWLLPLNPRLPCLLWVILIGGLYGDTGHVTRALLKAGKGSLAGNSHGPLSALPRKAEELTLSEPHLACLVELTGQTQFPDVCLSC